MPWFKLDCQFFTDDKIRRVTPVTRYSVICIFGYVKAFGSRGRVTADTAQIAAACMMDEEEIVKALRLPLFSVQGREIQVVNWQRYNDDPTNFERQKRHRQRQTISNGSNALRALRNDVTLEQNRTEENRREEREHPPTPLENFAWNREQAENHASQDLTADEAEIFQAWCQHTHKDPLNISGRLRTQIFEAIRTNLGPMTKAEILEIINQDQTKQAYLGYAICDYQKKNRDSPPTKPADIEKTRQWYREVAARNEVKK